ncbi:MAG: transcription termination factor Rho, partial [Calditrichaeota bacterium]
MATQTTADLKNKTIADLLKIAEGMDIPGVSGLRKSELIYKIMEHTSAGESAIITEGVLEILEEGYGFLRSPDYNYLPGQDDIYVSPSQIKRFDLKTGDIISGQVRPPKDNERYFALLKIEAVTYEEPEKAKHKTLFDNLTPLYPEKAFLLETNPEELTTRIIDLMCPIGKGQRALITSPPKAGKTIILQKIAQSITANHP